MSEYLQQAKDFLTMAQANMQIEFIGFKPPNGAIFTKVCTYKVKISTPLGAMFVVFYDSFHNTEIYQTEQRKILQGVSFDDMLNGIDINNPNSALKKAMPNEYDIICCLQKYDCGSYDDFLREYGYEKNYRSSTIYRHCAEQYADICRIFTAEQIGKMREIQ